MCIGITRNSLPIDHNADRGQMEYLRCEIHTNYKAGQASPSPAKAKSVKKFLLKRLRRFSKKFRMNGLCAISIRFTIHQ